MGYVVELDQDRDDRILRMRLAGQPVP